MRFGEVCDVSVLESRENFEKAKGLVKGGEIYLPSATYSWLARDRLISVRGRTLSYSLVSQFVRDGQLLVVYLPEILDEFSRRLLFEVEREVPLTDLRAMMLAAHLGVPYLTMEAEPVERLRDSLGARVVGRREVSGDWRSLKAALKEYREMSAEVGGLVSACLNNGGKFEEVVKGLNGGETEENGGKGLEFEYVAWNITPVLREYLRDRIVQPDVVKGLCEKTLLLVAEAK